MATFGPVESVIKNDGNEDLSPHEYNASYTYRAISASDFATLQAKILFESKKMYDLNYNNCAHFATNVLNSILVDYERIKPFDWWGVHPVSKKPIHFTNSPTGLYNKLKYMSKGSWTSSRITIGVSENAAVSNGECDKNTLPIE